MAGRASSRKYAGPALFEKGKRLGVITRKDHAKLDMPEAARAIYVDVEGFKDKSPSLVGILVEGVLEQVVLDPRLSAAAIARGCRVSSIEEFARDLRERCHTEGRKLVGYSEHELRVFAQHAAVDFFDVYRDARMIARKWWIRCRDGEERPKKLKLYLKSIGYRIPAALSAGQATSWLRSVIDGLGRKRRYRTLTKGVKTKWRDLLRYNAHDCLGMETLVTHAVRQLAAGGTKHNSYVRKNG